MIGDYALIGSLEYMSGLVDKLGKEQQEQIVSALLLTLRVPTRQAGYDYLVWAVQLYRQDPGQSMTKELYPAVAAQFGPRMTWNKVEKSIRDAVDRAWRECDPEVWKLFFPATGGLWARPSNREFISRLARLVDLWLGFRERSAG